MSNSGHLDERTISPHWPEPNRSKRDAHKWHTQATTLSNTAHTEPSEHFSQPTQNQINRNTKNCKHHMRLTKTPRTTFNEDKYISRSTRTLLKDRDTARRAVTAQAGSRSQLIWSPSRQRVLCTKLSAAVCEVLMTVLKGPSHTLICVFIFPRAPAATDAGPFDVSCREMWTSILSTSIRWVCRIS